MKLDGFRIISGGLPLFKSDGSGRAGRQTVSQSVAVVVPDQFCFSIYHLDGSLVACSRAGAASVTFFFIYLDNFSYHMKSLLDLMSAVYYNFLQKYVGFPTKEKNYGSISGPICENAAVSRNKQERL